MYRSGSFVAEHIEPVDSKQVQPNGVDLTTEMIYEQINPGTIRQNGKEIGDRTEIEMVNGEFQLSAGAYILQYGEVISVPEGHVGFVLPRSSLMRNSGMLNTAVWDAGYEGKGEGLLTVNRPLTIEQDARIAQFVLAEANHDGHYNGSYQHERINEAE